MGLTLRQVLRSAKATYVPEFLRQRLLRESMSDDDDSANKAISGEYRAIGEARPIWMPALAIKDKFLAAGNTSPDGTANSRGSCRIGQRPKKKLNRVPASQLFQTIAAQRIRRSASVIAMLSAARGKSVETI
jgi:hypothetical protein